MGYLDVVIPPDFISEDTSSDVIMPEGSTVKLTCRLKSCSPPAFLLLFHFKELQVSLCFKIVTHTCWSHFWGKLFRNTKSEIDRHQMANNCSYSPLWPIWNMNVPSFTPPSLSFLRSRSMKPTPTAHNRARGYPEPIVTWRREDGNEIVLKDSSGVKQLGECGWKWYGSMHRRLVS